jgi:hypothetical protein
MSLPVTIPDAAIETVLRQLILFFLAGANGDTHTARQAALKCLAAYQPRTEPELMLAAEVIGFGFHVRQSLFDAAVLDQPMNQVMRLRSAAARLGREAHRSLIMLEQLQRARQAAQDQPQDEACVAEPAPPMPEMEPDVANPPRPAASSTPNFDHLSKEAIRRLRPAEQRRIYLERMKQNVRRAQAEKDALT